MVAPEQETIERSCAGDTSAFEELVSRYEQKVYAIAYRFAGNHADAADLAQETFIKVYKALCNFRGESAFLTWVNKITANVCLDFLRKRQKVKFISFDEMSPHQLSSISNRKSEEPLEMIEGMEIQEQVQRLIGALPEEYRLILIMREIQGFSYEEIAETLKCSLGTVKSRLSRARAMLRERYLVETSPQNIVGRGSN